MTSVEKLHNQIYNKRLFVLFTWGMRILLFLAFLPSGLKKLLGERFTLLGIETPVGFFFEGDDEFIAVGFDVYGPVDIDVMTREPLERVRELYLRFASGFHIRGIVAATCL